MLHKLARLLTKFPVKSILITVIIVILLGFGVGKIFMATGNDTLVKDSTDVYKDNLMLEKEFGGESIIVLYESEQLLTAETLAHMKGLEDILQINDSIFSVLSPVTLMEEMANKQGKQGKQATLDNMIYEDGKLRPMFREVIIDDKHMVMMIRFKGDMTDDEKSDVVLTIKDYLDQEKMDHVETIVSGKPVLDNSIRLSMQENIQKMMGLALLIMIIVLFLVFKVRWRLIPLLTVLIAVIGTVGLMGWLKVPITMVSMAVFPILIGLGIDYAIQFQNRYTEEMLKEDSHE